MCPNVSPFLIPLKMKYTLTHLLFLNCSIICIIRYIDSVWFKFVWNYSKHTRKGWLCWRTEEDAICMLFHGACAGWDKRPQHARFMWVVSITGKILVLVGSEMIISQTEKWNENAVKTHSLPIQSRSSKLQIIPIIQEFSTYSMKS